MTAARRRPPGPKGHLLTGSLPEFRQDWLKFIEMCARDYGDVVSFRFGPRTLVFAFHPDDIEYILATGNQNFRKPFLLRMNRLLFGNSLVAAEGEFWLRQRRLVQPAFHRARIAAFAEMMVAYTERLLDEWAVGETRDVLADMTRLTLENVAKALFDADVFGEESEMAASYGAALNAFNDRLNSVIPIPEWVPTPDNLRLRKAIRGLDRYVFSLIDERRRSGQSHSDLLSMLLEAQDDDGSGMTDRQLRDEMVNFFFAGHETSAITLAWTFYLLSRHPEVRAKLEEEVDTVLEGRAPTEEDVPKLTYTDRVLTESMRLRPPLFAIGRQAINDCEIGGYHVSAGTDVIMVQWITQRDPRFFDSPETFNPDRWDEEASRQRPKYSYFPFGGGQRLCVGAPFAMMEMVLVVAAIVRKFRLDISPEYRRELDASVQLTPRNQNLVRMLSALSSRAGANLMPPHVITPQPTITLRPRDSVRMVVQRR